MRSIFVIILLAVLPIITQSQPLSLPEAKNKKTSLYFVATSGVLMNMNAADKVQPATGFLKIENTAGYKAGLEMLLIPRRKVPVLLNVGWEYRHVPHRYNLQYSSSTSGLGTDVNTAINFVVHSVALRIAPVYTIKLSASSNLDISAGFMFDAAVNANKQYTEEGLYVQDSKTGYNQLATFRFTGHGSYANPLNLPGSRNVGFNIMYYGSLSYRINPRFMGKRILRLGVEYGKTAAGNRVSQTTMLYMDKNRNIVARDWVSDKGTYISLFLGVSI